LYLSFQDFLFPASKEIFLLLVRLFCVSQYFLSAVEKSPFMDGLSQTYAQLFRNKRASDHINFMAASNQIPPTSPNNVSTADLLGLGGTTASTPSGPTGPTGPQGPSACPAGLSAACIPSPTGTCPTGPFCNNPLFHFPNLTADTATDCTYVPSFNDVPLTISMAVYFAQAFLEVVPFQQITDIIDGEVQTITNDLTYSLLLFTYLPLAIVIILVVWVLVIARAIDWQTGVLLTTVIVVLLWLFYIFYDTFTRDQKLELFTEIRDVVITAFEANNEDIICNLLKAYYAGLTRMIIPESSICAPSPQSCLQTGIPLSCTDAEKLSGGRFKVELDNIEVPYPSTIIDALVKTSSTSRCLCVENKNTLLPLIDDLCPCIKDINGFSLANTSSSQQNELLSCLASSLPSTLPPAAQELEKELTQSLTICNFPNVRSCPS
jgi:hypothetical protein